MHITTSKPPHLPRCSVLNLVLSFSINLALVSHSGQLFSCLLKIPISVVLFEVCSNLEFLKMPFERKQGRILGTKVTKTYGFFSALTSVLLWFLRLLVLSPRNIFLGSVSLTSLSVCISFVASFSCPQTDTFSSTCSVLSFLFSLPWRTQSLLWLHLRLQSQWSEIWVLVYTQATEQHCQ